MKTLITLLILYTACFATIKLHDPHVHYIDGRQEVNDLVKVVSTRQGFDSGVAEYVIFVGHNTAPLAPELPKFQQSKMEPTYTLYIDLNYGRWAVREAGKTEETGGQITNEQLTTLRMIQDTNRRMAEEFLSQSFYKHSQVQ